MASWQADDPRLRPLHPSLFDFRPIPASTSTEAKWTVSILDSSSLRAKRHDFCSFADEDEWTVVPVLTFLLERDDEAIMFDVGLREDVEGFMPATKKILDRYQPIPAPHPIKRLHQGGYDVSRIKQVIISHQHFDHVGDLGTLRDIQPLVVVGPGTLDRIGPGYPEKADSTWPAEWLKDLNIVDLANLDQLDGQGKGVGKRTWEQVACYDKAIDWFGDGSIWIIDAPGHCVGHLMALVRTTTSPDTYVLLAGDSAHAQESFLPIPPSSDLSGPDPRAPRSVEDGQPMMTENPERSAFDVGSLTRLSMDDDIMVLLAHETPAGKILPRWPESISQWKDKGWKEAKQKEVYESARSKGFSI